MSIRKTRSALRDQPDGTDPSAGTGGLRGVCILVTDIDGTRGGVQIQTERLIEGLSQLGVCTWIMTRNYAAKPRRELRGSSVILRSPAIRRTAVVTNSLLYLLFTVMDLLKLRRRYDVIHCQQMFGSAMAGLIVRFLIGKPVVVRVTSTGVPGEVSDLRAMRGARLRIALLKKVDRWIALTPMMRDEILSLGVEAERVVIVPNSAEIPELAWNGSGTQALFRERLELPKGPLALFSGRLSSEKGVNTLLDAWKLVASPFPAARLLILGSGGAYRNVEASLREQRSRLGLESSVELRGHVDNVRDYLFACDVFILPTRAEGMSNALVEAMVIGVPIVTTSIPAHTGVVEHGLNAFMVPPDDPQALAGAIARLFGEPGLGISLGRAARERGVHRHALSAMIARHVAVFSEVSRKP
jgi:glycosyltransferase involved in cell wall biosynthesis